MSRVISKSFMSRICNHAFAILNSVTWILHGYFIISSVYKSVKKKLYASLAFLRQECHCDGLSVVLSK